MKNFDCKSKIIGVLLIIIAILYISFLYIDIIRTQYFYLSNMLKFICIILCFTISLLTKENAFDLNNTRLLKIGLFLTVISDLLLLVIDDYYETGVIIFSIAQIIYSIRYDIENKNKIIRRYNIIFSILFLAYAIANIYFMKIDILALVAVFYGICLITNVIKAIKVYIYRLFPNPNGAIVALGMVLFLLCDINVALYNVLGSINITGGLFYSLHNISFVSMWLFYLPSQVLLSLSGYKFDNWIK